MKKQVKFLHCRVKTYKIFYSIKVVLILISCIFIGAYFIGCTEKETTSLDIEAQEIDLIKNVNYVFNYDSKITIEKIVDLESVDSSLVSNIDKIIFNRNDIYILDKTYTSLRVFNQSGRYKFSIGSLGQGPGEFLNIDDFLIKDNKVLLLSNTSRKVIEYTLQGKFIGEKLIKFFSSQFVAFSDDKFGFYTNYNFSDISGTNNLLITDADYQIVEKRFPYRDQSTVSFDFSGFVTSTNGATLFSLPLDDNLFIIDSHRIINKFHFNFGAYKCPEELKSKKNLSKFYKKLLDLTFLQRQFVLTDSLMSFSFISDKKTYNALWDRTQRKMVVNDRNSMLGILGTPIYNIDNNFVVVLAPEIVQRFVSNKQLMSRLQIEHSGIYEKIVSITEESNPVLIFYRYK